MRTAARLAGLAFVCGLAVAGMVACTSQGGTPLAPAPAGTAADLSAAEGLAYVSDGAVWAVASGVPRRLSAGGGRAVAVSYDRSGRGVLVTSERGDTRSVTAVAPGSGSTELTAGLASTIGEARGLLGNRSFYIAETGDPTARLSVQRVGRAYGSETLALRSAFSGEFDIDASGSVVYTGPGQSPAEVVLRRSGAERPIAPGMATAFAPSFSPDARSVCFTGARRQGDPISLWSVSLASGKPVEVAGSSGLSPMTPAFSPDGRRIAFRSALDGSLWVTGARGGEPVRLPVRADEAPIDW